MGMGCMGKGMGCKGPMGPMGKGDTWKHWRGEPST
jgi:hypothetical protein